MRVRGRGIIGLALALLVLSTAAGCARQTAASTAPGTRLPSRLVRLPFVQYLTPDGAAIEWETICGGGAEGSCSHLAVVTVDPTPYDPEPPVEIVRVRPSPDVGLGPGRLVDQRVELKGLSPGDYSYVMVSEDRGTLRQADEPSSFWLGPLPQTGSLRFVVIGDTGSGSEDQAGIARVLEREEFNLGFIDGDIVRYPKGEADYDDRYFRPYRRILPRVPLYPVLGNHDVGEYWPCETREVLALGIFDVFRREFAEESGFRGPAPPRRYYSTAVGRALFVVLDSNQAGDDLHLPPEEHAKPGHETCPWNWARRELERPGFDWKFVLLHHPPFSSGIQSGNGGVVFWPLYGISYAGNGVGWAWNPIFGWTGLRIPHAPVPSDLTTLRVSLAELFASRGVDVVFTSHEHDFEITRPMRRYDRSSDRPVPGNGPTGDCPLGAEPEAAASECVFEKGQGPIYVVTGGGGRELHPVGRSDWTVTSFSDFHAVFIEIEGREMVLRVEPQGLRYVMR